MGTRKAELHSSASLPFPRGECRWRAPAMREGGVQMSTRGDVEDPLISSVPTNDNTFLKQQQLGEQSTVTVLVASMFCCCFLFLSCVALACGYMFLLIWGAYILDNSDSAKTNACEDSYHIWTFCLLKEIVGRGVKSFNGRHILLYQIWHHHAGLVRVL